MSTFEVGDRVSVKEYFAGKYLPGWEGTVIAVNGDFYDYDIGVEFDSELPDGSGHSCDGIGEPGHCRWGKDEEVCLEDLEDGSVEETPEDEILKMIL